MLPLLGFGGDALDDDVTALAFVEELLEEGGEILGGDGGDLYFLAGRTLLRQVGSLACLSVGVQEGDPYAEAHTIASGFLFGFFVEHLRDVHLLVLITVDLTRSDGAENVVGTALEVVGLGTRSDEVDGEAGIGDRVIGVVGLHSDAVRALLLLTQLVEETVLQEWLEEAEGKTLALGELLISEEGELYFAQVAFGIYLEGALDDTLMGAVVTEGVGATWSLGVARQGSQIGGDDALGFGFTEVADQTACYLRSVSEVLSVETRQVGELHLIVEGLILTWVRLGDRAEELADLTVYGFTSLLGLGGVDVALALEPLVEDLLVKALLIQYEVEVGEEVIYSVGLATSLRPVDVFGDGEVDLHGAVTQPFGQLIASALLRFL